MSFKFFSEISTGQLEIMHLLDMTQSMTGVFQRRMQRAYCEKTNSNLLYKFQVRKITSVGSTLFD